MRAMIWLGLAALAMLGCGADTGTDSVGNGAFKVGIVYDEGGLGDKSFNDSAARGIQKAKDEFGVEVIAIESQQKNDYESNLRRLADRDCDIVFGIGFNMQSALSKVAKEFPDTKFALVDEEVDLPNVRGLKFKEQEGSFMVGYLAALMSESGKIGFVGGQESDLIAKFEFGYRAGALMANPNVVCLPAKYTGSWDNIDIGRESANSLFGAGADIVYHAAGRAGLGVIRAAAANGKYAIGVDSDQDGIEEGSVLTSMIKRVDEAIFQTVSDAMGEDFSFETINYGLAEDGVGVSEMRFTRDAVGEENLAKLEAVRQEIIDGTVVVPKDEAGWDELKKASLENNQLFGASL